MGPRVLFVNSHGLKKKRIFHICKWFFSLTLEKKRKHITHLWAHKYCFIFTYIMGKKGYCTFVSLQVVFFLTSEKKWNDITPLWVHKYFLIYSHSWRKRMMLHTCESTSGLRLLATNVGFLFTKPKKKWYCTFIGLQVAFIIDIRWRITMVSHTWEPTSGFFQFM